MQHDLNHQQPVTASNGRTGATLRRPIVAFGQLPHSASGGSEEYFRIFLSLIACGFNDVPVLVFSHFQNASGEVKDTPGWRNIHVPCYGISKVVRNVTFHVAGTLALLFAFLGGLKPKVVLIQYNCSLSLIPLVLCKCLRVRTILIMHVNAEFRHLRRRCLRRLSGLFVNLADSVWCIAEAQLAILSGLGMAAKRMHKVPNLIAHEFFDHENTLHGLSYPVRIIYIGRLEPAKGLSEMLTTVTTLNQENPGSVVLTLVGPASRSVSPEALRLLRSLERANAVQITGPVYDTSEKIRLLDTSDILLCLSRHEAAPLSLIEAMSRGCIPIISDVGDMPRIVQGTGIVVPRGDALVASQAIRRICGWDIERLKTYRKNAVVRARELCAIDPYRVLLSQYA